MVLFNCHEVLFLLLEGTLLKLSSFIKQKPEIKDLDLKPMFAYSDGVAAVYARVILEPQIQ